MQATPRPGLDPKSPCLWEEGNTILRGDSGPRSAISHWAFQ